MLARTRSQGQTRFVPSANLAFRSSYPSRQRGDGERKTRWDVSIRERGRRGADRHGRKLARDGNQIPPESLYARTDLRGEICEGTGVEV